MRILIVEDEERVSQFLRKGFEAESYTIDVAEDGEEGSHHARTKEYDVIILDVMLPRKNGFDVLSDIRKANIATPVLMLSAKADLEDRLEGLNLGADDYLAKPFAFSEVLARVRALVRRTSAGEPVSILTAADLQLDLVNRRVTRGTKSVLLTNKEFQILEYMMRNQGRILSRVILQEQVWELDFDPGTNIVDVLINRLRRKIDDDFPLKLIRTVRGVGYILEDTDETTADES